MRLEVRWGLGWKGQYNPQWELQTLYFPLVNVQKSKRDMKNMGMNNTFKGKGNKVVV